MHVSCKSRAKKDLQKKEVRIMPWFEIGGKLFETEYGPITEKEVFEALDDMTAFYILSEGNFDEIRLQKLEQIGMASAHETLQRTVRSGMGIGAGIASVIPGPGGNAARKSIGVLTGILEYAMFSSTTDAYMRSQIKREIKRKFDRELARQEGRS